jgi:hypothetical protein
MSILKIGYLLIDNINSKTDINKIKLMSSVGNYKKEIENNKKIELDLKNKYMNLYENKRIRNKTLYDKYINENKLLFNKWKKNNKPKDLYEYISHKKPDLEEVEDIYTLK